MEALIQDLLTSEAVGLQLAEREGERTLEAALAQVAAGEAGHLELVDGVPR